MSTKDQRLAGDSCRNAKYAISNTHNIFFKNAKFSIICNNGPQDIAERLLANLQQWPTGLACGYDFGQSAIMTRRTCRKDQFLLVGNNGPQDILADRLCHCYPTMAHMTFLQKYRLFADI